MSGLDDLRAEAQVLRDLIDHQGVEGALATPFHGWRVRDSIAHMATIDRLARLALSDVAAFDAERAAFGEGTRGPGPAGSASDIFRRIAAYERTLWDHLAWPQLLAAWAEGLDSLCAAAASQDQDGKVGWFGAPMRGAALIAARQMEVWAYGQDVFDACGARRPEGDRLKIVVEFALRTFGFSFANRGLPVPAAKPALLLTAPAGSVWTWNDPGAADRIEGAAVDLCLVACQRRHLSDTALQVTGQAAQDWMRIAQCIAGPPIDGPRPGERGGIAPGQRAGPVSKG